MLELLKRFEEENQDDGILDDAEPSELATRLADIDLGEKCYAAQFTDSCRITETVSSEELWQQLTPSERTQFLHTLNNLDAEAAQSLLSSADLQEYSREPWWASNTSPERHRGDKPEMYDIPPGIVKLSQSGLPLVYNLVGIMFVPFSRPHRDFGSS